MLRLVCSLWFAVAISMSASIGGGVEPSSEKIYCQFVGSTPRGPEVAKVLAIPPTNDVECTWTLDLFEDDKHAPTRFVLKCEYGKYDFQKPKHSQKREGQTKEGKWKFGKETKSSNLRTLELDCGLSFCEISGSVIHLLSPQSKLLVGNGGWSYSLNRAEVAEKPGDWELAMTKPNQTHSIAPVSKGANVSAIYEGRTPYKGIADMLGLAWDEGCIKAKWRITLYQDADAKAPTDYKIEGSLFRSGPRTGTWSIEKGDEGKPSRIRLHATKRQTELVLLSGDDNVLFILDKKGEPLVGHADFSYVMNRKAVTE